MEVLIRKIFLFTDTQTLTHKTHMKPDDKHTNTNTHTYETDSPDNDLCDPVEEGGGGGVGGGGL